MFFLWHYFKQLFAGLGKFYFEVLVIIIKKISIFNKNEMLYYFFIIILFILTIPGWRAYDITLNSEVMKHNLSTDDFLIYLMGFILMGIPGILKLLKTNSQVLYSKILFVSGFCLNAIFYFFSIIYPERISPVIDAQFTLWFYFFGFMMFLLLIIGVRGFFFKPSTHSRNLRH